MSITLTLPWPPSVNGYWRAYARGKRVCQILSKEGRAYKVAAAESLLIRPPGIFTDHIFIEEWFYPPDRRRRDMDNYRKAYRDALTDNMIIEDDSLIKEDHGHWCEPDKYNPRIEITIKEIK